MKKTILLILSLIISAIIFSQENILLTINDDKVTADEFLRIYKKNNPVEEQNDPKSLDEYLELFINFKLKVAEAKSLGYDTMSSFMNELEGYRKQLAKPYLVDKDVDEELIEEAYYRTTKDIHASHILFTLDPNASPEDTLYAYNMASGVRKRILKGEDFEKLARRFSKDPSVERNGGDLGYFTGFQMVYPFEDAAFNTKPGEISEPVRTRFGYHIVKVHDIRDAFGQIRVAHIMKTVPKDTDEGKLKQAEKEINEIYNKIIAGEDFSVMAEQFSDDKGSARRGGELPIFGTGRMVPEFEKAAFQISSPGEISKPVKTSYGWHIIKLIEKKGIKPLEEMRSQIKKKIASDGRSDKSVHVLVSKLKKENGFKENTNVKSSIFKTIEMLLVDGYRDAKNKKEVVNYNEFYTHFLNKNEANLTDLLEKKKKLDIELFAFAGESYVTRDFVEFLKKDKSKKSDDKFQLFMQKKYDEFIENVVIKYEEAHLKEKYPEYRYLLKEYHDGILLFELTDKLVWTKAVEDSAGLQNFYEKNKNNYMWDTRVDATTIGIATDRNLTGKKRDKFDAKIRKAINKGFEKELSEGDLVGKIMRMTKRGTYSVNGTISIFRQVFAKGDNELVDEIEWKIGLSKKMMDDTIDNYVYIHKFIEPTPKSLSEARGQITADYQTFLEKEWIESLRKKYDIELNEKLFAEIKAGKLN